MKCHQGRKQLYSGIQHIYFSIKHISSAAIHIKYWADIGIYLHKLHKQEIVIFQSIKNYVQ